MSPGGAKPLTSPTWLSLRPIRFRSASKSSSCSTPWMTPKTHQVMWSWIRVICPGRQTSAMIENEPSGSTCSVWRGVVVGRAEALLGGEDVRGWAGAGAAGSATSCAVSAQSAWRVDGGADAGDERAQLGDGADLGGGHASSLRAGGPYVQCQFSS